MAEISGCFSCLCPIEKTVEYFSVSVSQTCRHAGGKSWDIISRGNIREHPITRHCGKRGDEAIHEKTAGSAGWIDSFDITMRNEYVFRDAHKITAQNQGVSHVIQKYSIYPGGRSGHHLFQQTQGHERHEQ
jgi:hypothetical protein